MMTMMTRLFPAPMEAVQMAIYQLNYYYYY